MFAAAVPVVFDMLTPLLHAHGGVRVIQFLKSLRIVVPPPSSSSSLSSVLSPVVVPVMHESLRPSEQRSLEDVSDALVHLRLFGGAPSSGGGGGVGGRGPSSVSAAAANNDVDGSNKTSAVVVVSGILDLVRRGGGGGRTIWVWEREREKRRYARVEYKCAPETGEILVYTVIGNKGGGGVRNVNAHHCRSSSRGEHMGGGGDGNGYCRANRNAGHNI